VVIDDEPDLREMLNILLKSNGYNVVSAANGKDAIKTLKKLDQKPDLVLVDMFMPEMSGREVCEKIRNDGSLKEEEFNIDTILLTGIITVIIIILIIIVIIIFKRKKQ